MKVDSSNVQSNFITQAQKPKAEASPVSTKNNDSEVAEKVQKISDLKENEKKVQQDKNSMSENSLVDISI